MAAVTRSDADFGARMRRAREERSVSLSEIADATTLSVRALEALERSDFSRMPGGLFSRAFVRSYAAAVGVDPEQTVRDFLSQCPPESTSAGSPHAIAGGRAPGARRLDPLALMLVGTLVLAVAAILLWSLGAR